MFSTGSKSRAEDERHEHRPSRMNRKGTEGASFHATRWTLVTEARGEGEPARTALSELCAAYYRPVVAFLCRDGRDEDTAREVAHEFSSACCRAALVRRIRGEGASGAT